MKELKARPLIALAGNPNTGKTTLFNALTRGQARVGNYPGVTVECAQGEVSIGDGSADIIDIPGTYSLVSRSKEEQVAVSALLGLDGNRRPDAVVFCVDATQLHRSLYLVLQALEFGVRVVVALTMIDELEAPLDTVRLSEVLGVPVVGVTAPQGLGLDELLASTMSSIESPKPTGTWLWEPSASLSHHITLLSSELEGGSQGGEIASNAMALWLLMSVDSENEVEGSLIEVPASAREILLSGTIDGVALDSEVVSARYGWLDESLKEFKPSPNRTLSNKVDRFLVHPVFGFAIFIAIMFIIFQALFSWSGPAIDSIEGLFSFLGGLASVALPAGFFSDLIVDGIIGGVGAVVVFMPQILLLFFFVGLMEASGYMARVAYLMDRIMRLMKLNGRAFVPMLSGFACAIPAIMATRTMERKRDRLLTMMVLPLMTCSARLPVYTLIIAALFENHQATVMIGMYLFSVVIALFVAWVFSKTVFKAPPAVFVIELPPYRVPLLVDVLRDMWRRSKLFLTEAGTVILGATIAMWLLLSFPKNDLLTGQYETRIVEAGADTELVEALEYELDGELLRSSYAGRVGQAIEPVIEPLGYDWKIGVGLIGAFSAREVFVSTMGIVYNVGGDVDEDSDTLRGRIKSEMTEAGTPRYSMLTGLSLLVFFALASQCIGTLAVVKRETSSWRWPGFLFGYTFVLAWGAAFVVYQVGGLFFAA